MRRKFFRPHLDALHDPFLMKGMSNAVARLKHAIDNEEKILIYGDYDVDGTTSVALVYSYLNNSIRTVKYIFLIDMLKVMAFHWPVLNGQKQMATL